MGIINSRYITQSKHVAKTKGWDYNLSATYLHQIWKDQGGRCAYSGLPLKLRETTKDTSFTASLDRIDSSQGYVKGNVQWVHRMINVMKSNFDEKTFVDMCTKVAVFWHLDK